MSLSSQPVDQDVSAAAGGGVKESSRVVVHARDHRAAMEMYSDEDYSSPEEGSDSEAMGDQDHLYNRHPVVTRPRPRSRKGRERSSISQSAVARQRNIKQKFVALLKKFKVTEEHGGPHGLNRDLDLTAVLDDDDDEENLLNPDDSVSKEYAAEIEDLFDQMEEWQSEEDTGSNVDENIRSGHY